MVGSRHYKPSAVPWPSASARALTLRPCTGSAMAAQASCTLAAHESTAARCWPTPICSPAGASTAWPFGAATPALIPPSLPYSRSSLAPRSGAQARPSAGLKVAAAIGASRPRTQTALRRCRPYPLTQRNAWHGLINSMARLLTMAQMMHRR